MSLVPEELAAELDELVRRIPGVATIYRPASLAEVVTAARDALRGSESALVQVGDADGTLAIALTIGVAGDSAAGATCRAVHDAIADRLGGYGRDAAITVTVAHVVE